jgi:hypothetical protein
MNQPVQWNGRGVLNTAHMTCPPGSSLFPEQETLAGDGGLHFVFTTDLQVVDREFQQTQP